jgi:hypothetical protein
MLCSLSLYRALKKKYPEATNVIDDSGYFFLSALYKESEHNISPI